MQQQDLSGAMLLYDDIDRKGFEGDLVLNGLAEFLRNLLVCKDEKVANLLQVVESFKDRYIATSKQVSVAYLISALNLLNETELTFKGARNKRLHVEMALIKLTYLQQAVELAAGSDGAVKKKLVEGAKPVAFRSLTPVEAKGKKAEENTEAQIQHTEGRRQKAEVNSQQPATAKLTIETEKPVTAVKQAATTTAKQPATQQQVIAKEADTQSTKPEAASPKLGMLSNIRQQFTGKAVATTGEPIRLNEERLQEHWNEFAQILKDNRNPANQSFYMARLYIKDHQTFEVVTNNNLEQKFIEGERRVLAEHLQQAFNNRQLLFTIVVDENVIIQQENVEKPPSIRDQYWSIVQQYPQVKELRDKLNLHLD
jgi:DNA polymerase-3 subunit gamma/tau